MRVVHKWKIGLGMMMVVVAGSLVSAVPPRGDTRPEAGRRQIEGPLMIGRAEVLRGAERRQRDLRKGFEKKALRRADERTPIRLPNVPDDRRLGVPPDAPGGELNQDPVEGAR